MIVKFQKQNPIKMKQFLIIGFIISINTFKIFSQEHPPVKKQKTLLDFSYGMTDAEVRKHLRNLLVSYEISNYQFDIQTKYHEFTYNYPIKDLKSYGKDAEARIRIKPNPYLLSVTAIITPPIDSEGLGVQKLYNAFKNHYGNPIKPLMKRKSSYGNYYYEAFWKESNFTLRWYQSEGDGEKIFVFYEASGEYYEDLKKSLDKKRGVIEVERKF